MSGFRRLYGSNPLHLLAHIGLFFVAGWSVDQIAGTHRLVNWAAWFLGAALLHDLVLLPLYSLANRGLAGGGGNPMARAARSRRWVNYVRVPAAVAGILLLVYFPVILGKSGPNYLADTGHPLAGYTRNWLLITAGLFLASGIVFLVRRLRARPPRPRPPGPRRPDPPAPR